MTYNIIYTLCEQGKCKSKWLENVKNLVISNGFANVWINQSCLNKKWFRLAFKQRALDHFLQQWGTLINSSSSGLTYKIFKEQIEINNYFSILNNKQSRILTAFRTRNHRLPVEVGRWSNTPIDERICHLCKAELGDEFHYLFICNSLNQERNIYIKPYYRNKPSTYKMHELMNSRNTTVLKNLSSFAEIIMKTTKITLNTY